MAKKGIPKPKGPLLQLLEELEDNCGLWAGAEESLLGLGHKRRWINYAEKRGYIEVWRTCQYTTYYQLTVAGKNHIVWNYWYKLEPR